MREVEKKINLENAQYEELMLELQLNKKSSSNGIPPGMDHYGLAGLHSSASAAALAASTCAAVTTSSGRPPLGQITQASLEGYMTDTSSVLGGHQPLITISQPNGIRKGTYHTQQIYWMLKQQVLVVFSLSYPYLLALHL